MRAGYILFGLLILFIILLLCGSAATVKYYLLSNGNSKRILVGTEQVSNARIETYELEYRGGKTLLEMVNYSRGGRQYMNYLAPGMRESLKWVRENTPQDSLFLCWWDYGHMIHALSGRRAIAYAPSKSIEKTLANKKWDVEKGGFFTPEIVIRDVARALTAEDASKTTQIMRKYDASYVFVHASDGEKSHAINYALNQKLEKAGENAILSRMVRAEEIDGLQLAYKDEHTRIYAIP